MLCCFSFFFIIICHGVCGFVCVGLYECLLCVGVHGELHWVFIRWILGVCMITRNPNSNLGIAQMLIVLSLCHESCQKKKKVFLLPKHEEIILVSFPRIDRNYKYKVSCNRFLLKFHYSLFWFLRKCRTLAAQHSTSKYFQMLSCLGFDDKETICRVEVFGLEFVNLKLLLPSAWFLKRIEDEKIIFFFPSRPGEVFSDCFQRTSQELQ